MKVKKITGQLDKSLLGVCLMAFMGCSTVLNAQVKTCLLYTSDAADE